MASLAENIRRLPSWRLRLGQSQEIVALGILGLIAFGAFIDIQTQSQGSPAATVAAYFNAMADGDAPEAYALALVQPVKAGSILTQEPDLAALLRHWRPVRPELTFGTVSVNGGTATVAARRFEGAAWQPAAFRLIRAPSSGLPGFPAPWRLLVTPALLEVPVPSADLRVSIDGLRLGTTPLSLNVAVWPGRHTISVSGSRLFRPLVTTVSAERGKVPVRAPSLSGTGEAAARAVVDSGLQACARTSLPEPPGCPQGLAQVTGPVAWRLIAAPPADLVYTSAGGSLAVTGWFEFEAVASNDEWPVGGAFEARLAVASSGFRIMSLQSVPGQLAAPPVPQADLVAEVARAFAGCAASRQLDPPGCPQRFDALGVVQSVRWKLEGDPTVGARSSFNGATGVCTIEGSYTMALTYLQPGLWPEAWEQTVTGLYAASLFWTGTKLVLVSVAPLS